MSSTELLRDRFRGAIVGTAVGDALGAPFEGHRRVDPTQVRRWQDADDLLRWTDDTAMTIGVARSLAAVGRFDGADMAQRFATAYEAEPWRGYGAGPPQIFAALRRGAPWQVPATRLFGGTGSFGNGAAMRAAPVGLWCTQDFGRVIETARDVARITHAHELGLQGAAAQAYAVGWLTSAPPTPGRSTARQLLDDLRRVAPAEDYRAQFDAIPGLLGRGDASTVAAALGNGISAVEAVPAALCAALRHLDSFPDAVTFAIALGGDTDTIAAMTGALVGARVGHEGIPARWRRRVEVHEELVAVADELLDAAQRR